MFAQRKKHSVGIVFEKIVLLAQRKVFSVFERMGPVTFGRHYLVKPSTTTFHLYEGQCFAKMKAHGSLNFLPLMKNKAKPL